MIEGSTQIDGSDTRTCTFIVGENFPSASCVYFLSANGKIKIGFSKNLSGRFQALKSANPADLLVLGWITGGRGLEKALLSAAAKFRIHGEWFLDCEDVRAIVALALTTGGAAFADDVRRLAPKIHPDVAWASRQLRKLAGSRSADDSMRDLIERAAVKIGASYWRAFDLWYGKARQLLAHEKDSIITASEQS